jgi:hypothetical protein
MKDEMPTITSSTYTSSSAIGVNALPALDNCGVITDENFNQLLRRPEPGWTASTVNAIASSPHWQELRPQDRPAKPQTKGQTEMQTRLVKVLIADSDKRVPLADRLLFEGDEQLTDLTDQELYFEIPIKEKLDAHNAKRVKIVDKESTRATGKETFLEPIRIRDLRMTVVTIATF